MAGNGAELWDGSSFNPVVLSDIRNKLFGNEDPVRYIKSNGTEDWETYGKNTPTAAKGVPYYVVPASTINSKVGSADYGMVVKLGGQDWMATSLTLTTVNDEDNVVLTLYLSDDNGTSKFYSGSSAKGTNLYCQSVIRNHLLTNPNWSMFQDNGNYSFAKRFLVQPKNIQYQHTETQYGRENPRGNRNMGSDALDELTTGWYSSYIYKPGEVYGGIAYEAWGDDYIWIPSATETGWKEYMTTSSVWKLSNTQRAHSKSSAWLRSASVDCYCCAYIIGSTGSSSYSNIGNELGIRPAIHLNLTAAGLGEILPNPESITTTYNGDVQTLIGVYNSKPTEISWYYKDIYEHTPEYVKVTPETELKNAGTHWVKVEITDAWIQAVNDEVDAEGALKGWSTEQIAAAKEMRSPKFIGNSVDEEGHEESDTVRWFKFTIKPKELDIPSSPVNTPKYNGGDISFSIGAYTADWNDNVEIVKPDAVKYENGVLQVKNAGTYSVKVKITSNNFCWAGTSDSATPDRGEKPINVTVLPKDLIINFESSIDGKFNISVGENVTFTAVPSAADVVAGDVVTPTITYYKGSDTTNVITGNGAALDASELPVGTYTLGAKLENKEGTANSNYIISTIPTKVIKVGSNKITIENVTWQYAQDNEHTAISGDSVVLTYNGKEFRFTVKETTEELRAKGVKVDSYTDNVQINATDGTVTVKVKLVPYDESFEFSDPNKTEVEFSLTVTINKIELKLSDFVWSAEPTNELEYTGNTQTVTIVSGLPSFLDVTYYGNSGLLVGTYTTTIVNIAVKNDAESIEMSKNYTSFVQEDYADYKYEWQITKKKIVANWTNEEHTTTDGKKVSIPKVSGVEDGILEYSYTKYPSGEAITLDEILASYSETEISVYNVTVKIADGKTNSYMLLNSKNEVKDEVTQRFSVGDNKKSVTVSLQETKVYFNNQPQAVKLNYTGEGITANDFAVEYKLMNADGSEGEATNVAPSAVGKYKVTITLQGEKANTHIIVGENVFEYVIAHKDRFILTAEAAASHPYKFIYENFHEYEQDIKEYLYNAENAESVVYIAHLAFEDTLADLLRQFANAEDITAWGTDGTLIEDLTTVLATGMMLRMTDGETVLNQLTISVMGDIDGDGDIGTADKARLNSYTLGNLELKGANLLACDLDGDGEVGTADKARLNAYTLGNLDIYVGLTLRATAQATSEAVSACDEPAVSACDEPAVSACDEPAVAELTFIEESEPTFVLSAAVTEKAATSVQTSAIYAQASPAAFEYAVLASTDEPAFAVSASTDESEPAYVAITDDITAIDDSRSVYYRENASGLISVAEPYSAKYAVSMTPNISTTLVSVELSGNAPIPSTAIVYDNNESDTAFAVKSYRI